MLKINELLSGQFPPERRQNLNTIWETYARWHESNFENMIEKGSLRVEMNWFRFASQFFANAVVTPDFELLAPDFISARHAVRECVQHLNMYGCAVLVRDETEQSAPRLRAADPRWWFPVRSVDGDERIAEAVAVPFSTDARGAPNGMSTLVMDYADTEALQVYWSRMSGMTISGTRRMPDKPGSIVPMSTRGLYGDSTYALMADAIAEQFRRDSQTSVALDKQANPHLAMPAGSIAYDSAGKPIISQAGSTIPMNTGDPYPSYVAWSGDYSNQIDIVSNMERRALAIAGINPTLIGTYSHNNAFSVFASGAALRRLAMPTVRKIEEIQYVIEQALLTIAPEIQSIEWGLPLDTKESNAELQN